MGVASDFLGKMHLEINVFTFSLVFKRRGRGNPWARVITDETNMDTDTHTHTCTHAQKLSGRNRK